MNIKRIPMTDKAIAFQIDYSMENLPSSNDIEAFIQKALDDGYEYVFEKTYFNSRMGAYVSYKPNSDEINYLYDNPDFISIGCAKEYPFGKGFILKTSNQTLSKKNPVSISFVYRGPAYFLMKCADHVINETALQFNSVNRHTWPLSEKSIFVMCDELYLDYNGRDKISIQRIVDTNRVPDAGDKFLGLRWPKFSSVKKDIFAFADIRLNANNILTGMDPETADLFGYRNKTISTNPNTKIQKISLY